MAQTMAHPACKDWDSSLWSMEAVLLHADVNGLIKYVATRKSRSLLNRMLL